MLHIKFILRNQRVDMFFCIILQNSFFFSCSDDQMRVLQEYYGLTLCSLHPSIDRVQPSHHAQTIYVCCVEKINIKSHNIYLRKQLNSKLWFNFVKHNLIINKDVLGPFLCPNTGNTSNLIDKNLSKNNPPHSLSLALILTHPGVILSHPESSWVILVWGGVILGSI